MLDIDVAIAGIVERDKHPHSTDVYVSELGQCKRKVAFRLLAKPEEPEPPARLKMLWLADRLHELVYEALREAGLLLASEVSLREELPEGLSGRLDYIRLDGDREVVGDVKTTHPNRVRYTSRIPDERAVLQVSTYAHYLGLSKGREYGREVVYLDRGGENQSILCEITESVDVEAVVSEYLEMRESVLSGGELPPPLPLEYMWLSRMSNGGGQLGIGPNWQCRYCRYECERRRDKRILLARIAPSYGYRWTSVGRKYLRQDPHGLSDFLFGSDAYASRLMDTHDSLLADDGVTPEGDASCGRAAPMPR